MADTPTTATGAAPTAPEAPTTTPAETYTLKVTGPYFTQAFVYTDESGEKPVATTVTCAGITVQDADLADAIVKSAKAHNVKVSKTTNKQEA